jgi:hypothetical protein
LNYWHFLELGCSLGLAVELSGQPFLFRVGLSVLFLQFIWFGFGVAELWLGVLEIWLSDQCCWRLDLKVD